MRSEYPALGRFDRLKEFARGQVFGVINLLNTFKARADWSAGFFARTCWVRAAAPAMRTASTTAVAILSLVSNMVFSTPSVRAATLTEITPAACPAANKLAALIVDSALLRKESRGLHYTLDYPQTDEAHFRRDSLLSRG